MASRISPYVDNTGLVFAYDLANTSRSYLGEPTANIWAAQTGFDVNLRGGFDMPYAYNGEMTQSVYSSGTWNNNKIWEVLHTAGTSGYGGYESWRLCVDQPLASAYNATRRVAIKICILEGSITDLALHSGGGNGGHNGADWTPIPESQVPKDCPQKSGWYQFLADGSWSSTTVGHCVGLGFISYNRVRILATEPMYYPANHLIPFTGVARSATQGLKDLTGNSTIDLTNVSFDSNAQMTFDGTNDYVNIGNLGTIGSAHTIECIFKSTSVVNYRNVFDMNYTTYSGVTGNVGPRLEQYSSGELIWIWSGNTSTNNLYNYSTIGTISANKWYHTAFVMNSGNVSMYLNGTLTATNSSAQGYITTFADFKIGRGFVLDSSRYYAGDVALMRVYNRTLTASEIQQNFNAIKGRYGL